MDVAAVEDRVDAGEHVEDLRPQLGAGLGDVRVGDQPDAQRGALGQLAADERRHLAGRQVEHVGTS